MPRSRSVPSGRIVPNVHYFVNHYFREPTEISSTITSPLIRPATPADAPSIRRVLVAAFPTDAEARLVELLTARGKATISLVAEVDGTVVGHILFSPATVGPPCRGGPEPPIEAALAHPNPARQTGSTWPTVSAGLGLAPVAVHPDFQNRGIGSVLVRAGLAECCRLANVDPPCRGGSEPEDPARQAGPTWVVLLGHETYYPRFGFAPTSRWNLTGDYGSSGAFQFLPLTAAANEIRSCHIRYAPEFGEIFDF